LQTVTLRLLFLRSPSGRTCALIGSVLSDTTRRVRDRHHAVEFHLMLAGHVTHALIACRDSASHFPSVSQLSMSSSLDQRTAITPKDSSFQARRQEMRCECFCKKWTFSPQNETKLYQTLPCNYDSNQLFTINDLHSLIWGGAYAPNAPSPPPAYGLGFLLYIHLYSPVGRNISLHNIKNNKPEKNTQNLN